MRARSLAFLAIGILLFSVALTSQTPPPSQGATAPGPPAPRAQVPARDTTGTKAATGTARIRGSVIAADTSNPLRRAQVRIVAAEQRVTRVAITDTEGRYQLSELPAGRYSISVARNGYVSLQFGQRRPFEPGRPLDLADGQVAEKIDFALPRGGVIAGRITDEVGEPLAGLGIRTMRYQYQPNGERRLMPVGGPMMGPYAIQTDDLGNFRVYGLMPGTYILSASVNPMGGAMVMPMPGGGQVTTAGSNDGSDGYTTTYYPGTASESEAQPVTVGIGQEASAFFSMIPARLSRISGMIRDSQGRPASGVNFGVRSIDGMGFGMGFGGTTGPDGSFTMLNVPPGEYQLEVRPMPTRMSVAPGIAAPEPEFASVPISVTGQEITGLTITTGPGATVSGTLLFDKPASQDPPQQATGQPLRVMFVAVDPSTSVMSMVRIDNGLVTPNGQFELKGVNGRGTFRMIGTQWTIKSVKLEGVDITDTPYDAKPGSNAAGLEIMLTNTQTTLSGGVRALNSETVKDYVVAIFPSNLREGDIPTRFVRLARPDQDGKYLIKGLPPAEYFAAAVETLEQGGQWDPAFQEQVRPRAKRFALKEGQALALDLDLIQ